MKQLSVTCIVYFESPFWVGVFEQRVDDAVSVCKVVFGAEPKDYEVYEFVLKNYEKLPFGSFTSLCENVKHRNPKRVQREVHRQVQQQGIGTKSQQALKMQFEEIKSERYHIKREQRISDKKRRFELKQQKKKEKHKGH